MASIAGNVAPLKAVSGERLIQIYRGNEPQPIVVQHAAADQRPYIHPIAAPDGRGILTENKPPHHPWQHGLYTGLNDVNGVGFWKEGLRNDPMDGSFHPKPLQPANVTDHKVNWRVETEWRDPQGNLMLTELQQWCFHDLGKTYELDVRWTLRAATDLTFGAHKYGGLFVRLPYREERGGSAINSEGQSNGEAEGKRARWVACSMIVDGRTDPAGIAVMDHPNNPEYPVPWRVDNQLGFAPSRCIAGSWGMAEGSSQTLYHRVMVFCGETDVSSVDRNWHAFAQQSFGSSLTNGGVKQKK